MQSKDNQGLHVAIIMDGNGRWATRRGLPRVAGHRAGVAAVRQVVQHAPDLGIRWLTLYAFSSENWRRPVEEVESLFWLLRAYLRLETERLRQSGVRLKIIGRRDRLPNPVLREITRAEDATDNCCSLQLRLALDYSSRDAITRAAASVTAALSAREVPTSIGPTVDVAVHRTTESRAVPTPRRPPSLDLLRRMLAHTLTTECGEVDLLIRTGGEKRLSDFLLWESAYAELLFLDSLWPDFDATDLDAALQEFNLRERRFGAVPRTTAPSKTSLARDGRP